jgi:ubiquinone/menaquinone biosynthesis C-methylase UbiE
MSINELQLKQPATKAAKPYKGTAMEGLIAKWYTKIRAEDPQRELVVRQVREVVPPGGVILEVAPGPGYLAIELAKLGKYRVVGLDISKSFVQIAQTKAREAGVEVDFRHGNAAKIPFEADVFDFIVCVAAFKNFTEPVQALREMQRVVKPGGQALINDLRGDASPEDIRTLVNNMDLNPINAFITKWTFKHILLKNAYTKAEIQQFIARTDFTRSEIREDNVSMEIWLEK